MCTDMFDFHRTGCFSSTHVHKYNDKVLSRVVADRNGQY